MNWDSRDVSNLKMRTSKDTNSKLGYSHGLIFLPKNIHPFIIILARRALDNCCEQRALGQIRHTDQHKKEKNPITSSVPLECGRGNPLGTSAVPSTPPPADIITSSARRGTQTPLNYDFACEPPIGATC